MNADRTPPGYLDFGFVHGMGREGMVREGGGNRSDVFLEGEVRFREDTRPLFVK